MFCEFCGDGGKCAVCGHDQDAAEELRRLDGSLGLDAEAGAADAVHEFAESIETDVRYALGQIRGFRREDGMRTAMDRISRALDALESVEERIAAVTCEDAAVCPNFTRWRDE